LLKAYCPVYFYLHKKSIVYMDKEWSCLKEERMSFVRLEKGKSLCGFCETSYDTKEEAVACSETGRGQAAYELEQEVWYVGPLYESDGGAAVWDFRGIAEIVKVGFHRMNHAPIYDLLANVFGRELYARRVFEPALSPAPFDEGASAYVTEDRSLRAIFREDNPELPHGRTAIKGLPLG
jgi:hypothetical protein